MKYHKDWGGIFVDKDEFSGFYNWAMKCGEEQARCFLVDTAEHVPTLRQDLDDARFTLDPLSEWAEEELQKGTGSLVGFKKFGSKAESENERRYMLYPAYVFGCEKRGITPHNHRTFSEALLHCLITLDYKP